MEDELELFKGNFRVQEAGTTFSVIILDKSGSMRNFNSAPKDAVNAHIASLQKQKGIDARTYFVAVVSFADLPGILIPFSEVSKITALEDYFPDGSTLLYKTVYMVLYDLRKRYFALADEQRENLKVVVSVISDGDDNQSDKEKYPKKLQKLVATMLPRDWTLLTYGIGISGKKLAANMGFPTDDVHAFNLNAGEESFAEASESITCHTTVCKF